MAHHAAGIKQIPLPPHSPACVVAGLLETGRTTRQCPCLRPSNRTNAAAGPLPCPTTPGVDAPAGERGLKHVDNYHTRLLTYSIVDTSIGSFRRLMPTRMALSPGRRSRGSATSPTWTPPARPLTSRYAQARADSLIDEAAGPPNQGVRAFIILHTQVNEKENATGAPKYNEQVSQCRGGGGVLFERRGHTRVTTPSPATAACILSLF